MHGRTSFLMMPIRLDSWGFLSQVVEHYDWICHAYCLMMNHYHLLIETPEVNLSKGMRQLNGVYTQAFNRDVYFCKIVA
jgi:REP element-mobilizing transposase RayT